MIWEVIVGLVLASFIGACLGSFYFASATRVVYYFYGPTRKLLSRRQAWRDFFLKPSYCMSCGTPIGSLYLMPVLGFFFSRGKCSNCGEKISLPGLLAEIYPAIVLPLLLWSGYSWPAALITVIFLCQMFISIYTDFVAFVLDHENTFMLSIAAAVLLYFREDWKLSLISAGITLVLFLALFWIASRRKRAGLGFGDVPLAVVISLFAGYPECLIIFMTGALLSIFFILRKGKDAAAPLGAMLGLATLAIHPVWSVLQQFHVTFF